ncbi:MAG: ribonuclease HII [Chloroflexota bacterium]
MTDSQKPTFAEERQLWKQGCRLVAGVDEVGRGALAGPVCAAAVVLPAELKASWLKDVRDSKLLSPKVRERLAEKIRKVALGVGVGIISVESINAFGIAVATRMAMRQAIDSLKVMPDTLLIDFFTLPDVNLPQKGVVDGDTLCFSIACASIVAKVARDELMTGFDRLYPGYALAENKGYGTGEHLECLRRLGPCAIHRHSFQPVKDALDGRHEA